MFYLKELLLIIRDHKALAFANMLLLCAFTLTTQYRGEVKSFFSMDEKISASPYFSALVKSGANPDYISRKMRNLPGVSKVEVTHSGRLAKEAKEFLTDLGESPDAFPGAYNAFKVVIDNSTKPQSRKLIKEYFSRLVGKEEVTFTSLKKPTFAGLIDNKAFSLFARWSDVYLASLAALGWMFTLFLIGQPISSQAFVIERFQRKTSTSLKIYLWLFGIPAAGSFIFLAFKNKGPDWLGFAPGLLLLALGAAFFIKKAASPRRFI